MKGKAVTPTPRSWSISAPMTSGCDEPTNCSVQVADTVLRQGQGMHGSFGRGDTMNFMAAIGPDFKAGYVDPLPVSNADVGMTIAAKLLGLTQQSQRRTDRPRDDRSDAQRRYAEGRPIGLSNRSLRRTACDGAELPARRCAALFRRRGLPGPHRRARATDRQTKNGGEITPPSPKSSAIGTRLHPDVEHVGNAARAAARRRRRTSQPSPSAYGCGGACRASGLRSIPALRCSTPRLGAAPSSRSSVSGDSATVRGGTGRPDSEAA